MKQILVATKNVGKINELKQLMACYKVKVLSLDDMLDDIEIEETGSTFEENALLKAHVAATKYKMMALADDSGLEIDALNGNPGVYSARYASQMQSDDEANMDKVLYQMKDVADSERGARFVCVLAVVNTNAEEFVVRGECEGLILRKRCGAEGFGYDPIFYIKLARKPLPFREVDESPMVLKIQY